MDSLQTARLTYRDWWKIYNALMDYCENYAISSRLRNDIDKYTRNALYSSTVCSGVFPMRLAFYYLDMAGERIEYDRSDLS